MKGLILLTRTSKKEGSVKLRFRLRDGRAVDLFHSSDISAEIQELSKFMSNGEVRPRVSLYNRKLKAAIDKEMSLVENAYESLKLVRPKESITSEVLEAAIDNIRKYGGISPSPSSAPLLALFRKFIDDGYKEAVFGMMRKKHYDTVYADLHRFLLIKGDENRPCSSFSPDDLVAFRDFLASEKSYVRSFRSVYADYDVRKLERPRSQNTIATKLKKLQAFFNELVTRGDLDSSPFSKMSAPRRRLLIRESYDIPVCLTAEEYAILASADIPDTLCEVRACFMLHCTLGCRISDYKRLSVSSISVSEAGIPYIHYVPQKTSKENHEEVITPILHNALDIIKRWQFRFPLLRYASGKSGYNVKIKELLYHCSLIRLVKVYNPNTTSYDTHPLYEFGGSKMARKTYVDMMNKVQIDMYAAGLHRRGSEAVKRYTDIGLRERFILASIAFGQPLYKVGKDLNVIAKDITPQDL